MSTILEELNEAVQGLQGLYQPFFGHENINVKPMRICVDRLPNIKKIYDALSKELNRPLRVLDLGCNFGFFSFHAAKWGGVVTGVDFDEKNIRICNILAREHPDYKINFVQAKLEEFIPNIKEGEYDLVLGFSVFHWVAKIVGFAAVKSLLTDLSNKTCAGIFELALKPEFPEFDIPNNYREFLSGYAFIRVVSYNTWSNININKRPFCFASNKYVYFENDLGVMKIDYTSNHAGGSTLVKYYHCGNKFIKLRRIVDDISNERTQQEIVFLNELGGQNGLPKIYFSAVECDTSGVVVFIVRDKIEGTTLYDKIKNGEYFDRSEVVRQILQWMAFFEKHGYYQSDLNPSNFIISESGKVYPIDYELIIREPLSIRWPYNIRLAIFNFINSILKSPSADMQSNYPLGGNSLTEFRKYISKYQYEQISKLTDSEGFFERLYEILFSSKEKNESHTMAELEILAMQKYFSELKIKVSEQTKNLDNLNKIIMIQQQRIEQLEKIIKEKLQ